MERKHNEKITPFAKELRKNMTPEEKHLWYDFLNKYTVRFYRQKVLGKYIADFYCAKASLTGIEPICLGTINPQAFIRPLA